MSTTNPVGVVASAFILLKAKDSGFPGRLSSRLPSLPMLTVLRIGGVINFLAFKGITDQRAAADAVIGEYPMNVSMHGPKDRSLAQTSVQNALQAMVLSANLQAAMQCVVGMQESIVMLGVDKIIGAANTTLKGAYSAYGKASTAYDYGGKGKTAAEKLKELKTWIDGQRGESVDIFITTM